MRKEHCTTGNFYYISNSGNRGGDIFLDKHDYMRFIFSLGYFNTTESVGLPGNTRFLLRRIDGTGRRSRKHKYRDSVSVFADMEEGEKRQKLVDIVSFSLVPGSYHLMLRQRKDDGIAKFMQKIGTGYTAYANARHEQSGRLFRGPYRIIPARRADIDEIIRFIHLQPIGLIQSAWTRAGVRNWRAALGYLDSYPWSSFSDYIGTRNIAILSKMFADQGLDSSRRYRDFLMDWKPA